MHAALCYTCMSKVTASTLICYMFNSSTYKAPQAMLLKQHSPCMSIGAHERKCHGDVRLHVMAYEWCASASGQLVYTRQTRPP